MWMYLHKWVLCFEPVDSSDGLSRSDKAFILPFSPSLTPGTTDKLSIYSLLPFFFPPLLFHSGQKTSSLSLSLSLSLSPSLSLSLLPPRNPSSTSSSQRTLILHICCDSSSPFRTFLHLICFAKLQMQELLQLSMTPPQRVRGTGGTGEARRWQDKDSAEEERGRRGGNEWGWRQEGGREEGEVEGEIPQ